MSAPLRDDSHAAWVDRIGRVFDVPRHMIDPTAWWLPDVHAGQSIEPGDLLDTIDAAVGDLCACGCGTALDPDGPSAYFAGPNHQAAWNASHATDPGDVYRRQDAAEHPRGPARWRPGVAVVEDMRGLAPLTPERAEFCAVQTAYHATTGTDAGGRIVLRLDDGHRFVETSIPATELDAWMRDGQSSEIGRKWWVLAGQLDDGRLSEPTSALAEFWPQFAADGEQGDRLSEYLDAVRGAIRRLCISPDGNPEIRELVPIRPDPTRSADFDDCGRPDLHTWFDEWHGSFC